MIPILRQYLRPYTAPIVLVLFLLLVQAIANLYLPALNADIINNGVVTGDIDYIVQTGAFMLVGDLRADARRVRGGVLLGARSRWASGATCARRSSARWRRFSQVELNHFGAASLITRNTNDVQQVQQVVLLALTMMISAPILAIGGVIMAYRQDGPLTAILLVILPVMAVFIAVVMRRAIPLFQAMQVKIDRINLVMRETLSGVRVIRAFVRTEHEEQRFDEASRDLMDMGLRVNRLFAITMPVADADHEPVARWRSCGWARYRVDSGEMPIGNLTAFIQYITQILFAIMMAVIMFVMVPRAAVSAGRIGEVLDTVPSISDPPTPISPARSGRVAFRGRRVPLPGCRGAGPARDHLRGEPRRGHGDRRLHGLRQDDADQPAAALLRRDRRTRCWSTAWTSGSMDRQDLWRRIGMIPQKAFLFGGTVATNLQVGDPDASDDDMWRGARDRPGQGVRRRDARAARSRRSARAAPTSRAASGSAWRSPGPSPSGRTSTSSTTASAPSTSGPTRACGRRWPGS